MKKLKYDSLKLENQLCFALYASSRKITKLYKNYLDPLGLTYTQYITLLVLWEQDNITVKDLGNKLYLDSGTLTPLLKKLEGMNFITRNRDKEDERNVFVKLTEKGVNLKDEALSVPKELFCSTGLSLEEGSKVMNDVKMLLDKLNEIDE